MQPVNRRDLKFGLLIATIAVLTYVNSLANGFVLDDESVILNNPVLKGSILSLFNSIDTVGGEQLLPFYRPFTYLTYFIEGQVHGFNPFFVRLFNVLLHSANAFLVYRLARTFFRDSAYAALMAGLLFAVHPLHSEGVDFNAGGRNTMLACFFALASYLFHSTSIARNKAYHALTGALLFLAGLFSKEVALMILPLIISLEISAVRQSGSSSRWHSCLRLLPYGAAAGLYFIARWSVLHKLGIQTSILPGVGTSLLENMYVTADLGSRLLNNLYIIPRYLLTVIWPTALASRYVIPEDLNLLALPLLGAWLCILGGIGWLITRGRSSSTLFGLSWLVLFWLPVSGAFLVPGAPLADRFLYIPAIGLWIIVADLTGRFLQPGKPGARLAGAATLTVLLLLAVLTIRRNLDWRSNLTLYTRFVAQYPHNVHARAGLGKAYYGNGRERNPGLAEREFEKVVAIDPNFPMIYTYLGNLKLDKGDFLGALHAYDRAIEVYPYDKEAFLNRGITKEKLGRPKEALSDYLFFMASPGSTDQLPGGRQHAEQRIRELSK